MFVGSVPNIVTVHGTIDIAVGGRSHGSSSISGEFDDEVDVLERSGFGLSHGNSGDVI